MVEPEFQVLRFDDSIVALSNSCDTFCEYQCGSENPWCQGVCAGESCPDDEGD